MTKKDGTNGDLLATVEVQVPATLSDTAREALEAYRAGHRAIVPARRAADGRAVNAFGVPAPDAAVYVISVAAELTGLHPQTLRAYERMGLLTPGSHRRRWAALLPPRPRAAARDRRPHRATASGSRAYAASSSSTTR